MKSTYVKRWLSGAMASLMLLSSAVAMAACGKTDEETPSGTQSVDTKKEEETARPSMYESLTAEKFNKDFVILNRGDLEGDFYVKSYGGDDVSLLDQTIYERNSVIERDYGVTFKYESMDDYNNINTAVMQQVNGGLDEYDIAIGHKYSCTSLAQNNYLLNLNSIDTLQLENVWWDAACRENLTVNGKTYTMVGDILPSSMRLSSCFVFNKKMMKDMNKTEPYQMVRDGSWTLDTFNAMTAEVTQDSNGDGKMSYTDDIYGLTTWAYDAPYSMFYGAGGKFVSFNQDGTPELNYDSEHVMDIYAKLYMATIELGAYQVTDVSLYETNYDVFRAGRALFCDITLGKITSFLSDMEQDYGIVPVPKYDEFQNSYLSFVNGSTGFIMVANTKKNADFVGTVLDAMSAYNYDKVTPNMFEIITKLQAARDPDSSEMVDYICRNRIFDFAYFYDVPLANVVREQLTNERAEISSVMKAAERSSKTTMKKILAAYEKTE